VAAAVLLKSNEVQRAMLLAGSQEQWQAIADIEQRARWSGRSAT